MTNFIGSSAGQWRIIEVKAVAGESLPMATHVSIDEHRPTESPNGIWVLQGFASTARYVNQSETEKLRAIQQGLGRPQATRAALIPIRKNQQWWDLTENERREIFEERSHHIATGLRYLPAIARQLYHCRELFDFLTWFEYAPNHGNAFEELVLALRSTEEWKYVEREVDIRLQKNG